MMNESVPLMISINGCISGLINYIGFVTLNSHMYEGGDGWILRKTSSGGTVPALNDIDNIERAAIKCIEIILKYKNPK